MLDLNSGEARTNSRKRHSSRRKAGSPIILPKTFTNSQDSSKNPPKMTILYIDFICIYIEISKII
jgi:hypothetical protein